MCPGLEVLRNFKTVSVARERRSCPGPVRTASQGREEDGERKPPAGGAGMGCGFRKLMLAALTVVVEVVVEAGAAGWGGEAAKGLREKRR